MANISSNFKSIMPSAPKGLTALAAKAATSSAASIQSGSKTNMATTIIKKAASSLKSIATKIMNSKPSIANGLSNIGKGIAALGVAAGMKEAVKVAEEGIAKTLESPVTLIGGMAIGSLKMTTEVSEMAGPCLETVKHAMDKVLSGLQASTAALGAGLGLVAMAKGANSLCSAYRSHQRSEGLNNIIKDSGALSQLQKSDPTASKDIEQLKADLKICQENNKTKAKDLALSGAMDVAVGGGTLAVSIALHGAPAFIIATTGWIGSAAVKTGVQMMRGGETSPKQETNRHDIHTRLTGRLADLQKAVEDPPKEGLSTAHKATLVALKSVGMLPKSINIDEPLTDKAKEQLAKIKPEDIHEKLTGGTKHISLEHDSKLQVAGKVFMTFAE